MPGLAIQENVPLAPLSTLGVGGPARFYARAADREAVEAGAAWAEARALPLFVLGGGSNVVVADEGHPGLALHVVPEGVEARHADGGVYVRAGSEAPEAYQGIGIRIEDDVLVTSSGAEVLSRAIPKYPEEIERVCAG